MLLTCTVLACLPALALAAGAADPQAVIGTIASKGPVTIDGADMSPSAAATWPIAAQDEISNSATAMLRTPTQDVLTFEANSKARIATVETGRPYIYLRQGAVHFNAKAGLVYVCAAGRLFVPGKSAEGSVAIAPSGAVISRLERGAFTEQGVRACVPAVPPSFLSGLPAVAGATLSGTASAAAGSRASIGAATAATIVGTGAVAAATLSSLFASTCSSPAGCNANPDSISPTQP